MSTALRRLTRAIAVVTALGTFSTGPAQAQDLTLEETRALGAELIAAGALEDARRIVEALLIRDPEDPVALILAARITLAEGDLPQTAELAGRAFAAAEDPEIRFVAARTAARATFELGRYTRSQVWLRRARQLAPDDVEAEAVAEDFRVVRQLNPLSLDLRFGVRPSSNINNGSQSETSFLLGLPFELTLSRDAQALSGLAFELGGTARYRLSQSEVATTFADVSLDTTTYTLSSGARDDLEEAARAQEARGDFDSAAGLRDIDGSDYAFVQLSFGLRHRRILREGLAPTSFNARIGQTWYGGSPYTQFLDTSVGQSVQVDDRSLLRVFAGAQKTFAEDDFDDAFSFRLGGSVDRVLQGGNLLSLGLSGRVSRSDSPEREYDSVTAGVDYLLDAPVLGLGLAFGASVERRDFTFSSLTGGPRTDDTLTLTAEAEIGQVEYYGFRPVAQLEASRTRSDIALFDRDYISLGFDLRSAF
ncbi:hypothetical protein EU805_10740 [Salipiger sp. IMCC34102]|uniref:tetratricopeptide repeat protein n=1 Tax=Salipiger sp. IMCC34102 TaxID=2510647 RepID=UPI00101D0093|nr:hypothetical protein [Salipiger sp. IMCC34102]RYH02317.1 hypothetical protein EU805_10740 [Salipiger sp. IMCC34102]